MTSSVWQLLGPFVNVQVILSPILRKENSLLKMLYESDATECREMKYRKDRIEVVKTKKGDMNDMNNDFSGHIKEQKTMEQSEMALLWLKPHL
ncbi:hypothetical protein VNO77_17603 [Canavalia gladiata]|uniref:Uncharacterized protein n=1 Tax=Canavalia gladiata TaxID=3824 RepID=A0AAN9LJ79_CANGL